MKNKHIYNLTGIRALAALWVVFNHAVFELYTDYALIPKFLFNISMKGWMGVDLFFILSGFVMAFVHYQDFEKTLSVEKIKHYLFLRISRIYPVHLFCTLILVAIYLASVFVLKVDFNHINFTFRKLLYSLTLTNGLGIPDSMGWNYASWSLGAEFLAYLCFPFMVLFFLNSINSLKMLIGTIILIITFKISLSIIINHGSNYFLSEAYTSIRVLSCFTIGTLLQKIYKQVQLKLYMADFLSLGSLALIIGLTQLPIPAFYLYLYEILFIILIFSLSYDAPLSKALLGNKFVVYLGKISFSVYLLHSLVLIFFKQISKKYTGNEVLLLIIYIPLSHLLACPLYEIVENRSRNVLMRWYKK